MEKLRWSVGFRHGRVVDYVGRCGGLSLWRRDGVDGEISPSSQYFINAVITFSNLPELDIWGGNTWFSLWRMDLETVVFERHFLFEDVVVGEPLLLYLWCQEMVGADMVVVVGFAITVLIGLEFLFLFTPTWHSFGFVWLCYLPFDSLCVGVHIEYAHPNYA